MSEVFGHDALPRAIAAALADGFRSWKKENAPGMDGADAWAQFVKRMYLHAQLAPGQPYTFVVEVVDRRPGRSSLTSYAADPRSTEKLRVRNKR